MNKRDYAKFETLLALVPPRKADAAAVAYACRNWALLHPELAALDATPASLTRCREFMYVELHREGGPRYHIMDRLYKRFSNLRREIETASMGALLPEAETVEE